MSHLKLKYIENHVEGWAREFEHELGLFSSDEHDEVVRMACYTMFFKIANEFRDGEHYDEILKLLSK